MAPTMDEVAAQFSGRLKILALDVSEGAQTAVRYGVMGVPQVLFFKGGEKVAEIRGWASKADVVKKIESILQ
jgi:thioredoxin 1